MKKSKQLRLDGTVWEEAFEPQYWPKAEEIPPVDEDEDYEEEAKYCENCCHFVRCMDDMYQDRGICAFGGAREHTEEMECYHPDKYERCFW